jgi:peptide/nickel transport system permease protein
VSAYILRRCGSATVVVFLVTVIVFILLHHLPGGECRALLGPRATPLVCRAFDRQVGLNLPLPAQYFEWIKGLVVGYPSTVCPTTCHFGFSYTLNQSVDSLLAQDLPKSIVLIGMSTVLAFGLGIPLGILQAVRRNRPIDHTLTGISFVGYAMPTFWLGLVFIDVFAIRWHIFSAEGPQGNWTAAFTQFPSMVLPVLSLAVTSVAAFSRYQRSATLENMSEDYVRTARAKGLSERRIIWGHVLRNTLIPIVTLLGLSLPALLSGALIVEAVFSYPGMGYLFWNAALTDDYPVLMGVTLIVGIATVLGNLLADIGYAWLDPRVRYT